MLEKGYHIGGEQSGHIIFLDHATTGDGELTAVQVLKGGHCLGLFPEGTRSRTGKMRKAEAGVGLIAAMTGAPVVPAAILGTDKIFANGGFLPKLTILVGEPMHFTGDRKDKAQLEAFSQSILDEIARMKQTI